MSIVAFRSRASEKLCVPQLCFLPPPLVTKSSESRVGLAALAVSVVAEQSFIMGHRHIDLRLTTIARRKCALYY